MPTWMEDMDALSGPENIRYKYLGTFPPISTFDIDSHYISEILTIRDLTDMLLVAEHISIASLSSFHVNDTLIGIFHRHIDIPCSYPCLGKKVQHMFDFFSTSSLRSLDACLFGNQREHTEARHIDFIDDL